MSPGRDGPAMIPPHHYLDGAHLIPVDPHAEESLAGWAVADAGVAVRLVDELLATDFHDPRCWTVITAAAQTPELVDGDAEWEAAETLGHGLLAQGCAARTDAIAAATGLPWPWLAQLVERRSPVGVERLAERVVEVAEQRQRNQETVESLRKAEVDVRWLTNLDAIVAEARYRVLYVAEAIGDALYGSGTDVEMARAIGRLGAHFGLTEDEMRRAMTPEEELTHE